MIWQIIPNPGNFENSRDRTSAFKVRSLFFLVVCILSASVASAADSLPYIKKANALQLADHPLWKKLLHFHGGRSLILDKDFFLSDRGQVDPRAELEATIEAYFSQEHTIKRESGDKNIVCIFPARYAWLNEKLGLPGYKCDKEVCPALSDWSRLEQSESVSVVYVSGYLGNPASSFGHVLLNLKLKDSEELLGLFDTSVTYGATVPINENMVLYVLKGLFGGYYASFSDKFFYAHDQVYSNREFRDMWEYTLDLTDFEKKMLVYHIAELLTKRFRYYFLSANCAQRMAVLLDIFIEEEVYNLYYPIYVPEELFHRLQHIDTKRRGNNEPGLIKNIKYIPSAQRYLYYETERLDSEERKVYRNVTNSRDEDFNPLLNNLDVESRINVLNALLAYQYYKLMASDAEDADQRLKEFKNKILLERLRLPAKKDDPVTIPEIPSPRDVSPPSSFNVGLVLEQGRDPISTVGVTVFRKESVGLNALEYNELVALDLTLGTSFDSENVFVDTFDFLKIRDFKTFYIKEANENPVSWKVRAGTDRYNFDNGAAYDYVLDGGIGLVRKTSDVGIIFGFMNASLHSLDPQYRAGPSAGFVVGKDALKLQFDYGLEFDLEDFGYIETAQAKLQYQINRQNAVQISLEKADRERLTLNYIFYW
ncbi:MAG: hypothetical protein A3D10_01685 [Omnitrophica WOR_2 bacterium RIFCSPHIGHO2_02_FULL_48_11]|nr:MAG: hypothetical protein A3D10_01685 [Omnitrophica WOR_2 bacterium RIFCSPHIGHO2_02_FULL_48_11]